MALKVWPHNTSFSITWNCLEMQSPRPLAGSQPGPFWIRNSRMGPAISSLGDSHLLIKFKNYWSSLTTSLYRWENWELRKRQRFLHKNKMKEWPSGTYYHLFFFYLKNSLLLHKIHYCDISYNFWDYGALGSQQLLLFTVYLTLELLGTKTPRYS